MTISCRVIERIPVLDGSGRRTVVLVWALLARDDAPGAGEVERERWYRLENGAVVEPVSGSQASFVAHLDEGDLRLVRGTGAPG